MSIQVTPIPRLTVLAAPAFTLGTANAAGSAETSIASDSTLLAFDTTLPDAITFGQSGAVGSATVTSRRDHAHATASVDAASKAEMEAGSSTTVFDTPGRTQYHPGVAKVWCRITAAGALESPDYNVDSVTDTGAGDRTIVFVTPFSGTVYSPAVAVCDNADDTTGISFPAATFATGSIRLTTYGSGSLADRATGQSFYGDQ